MLKTENHSYETIITGIALIYAAAGLTAFAQDKTNTTPAGTPTVATKPYVRPWKGIELKAHECLTDAEDIQEHKIYGEAKKTPEVQAAIKAEEDAKKVAMIKFDPAMAPILEKLDNAMKSMQSGQALATLTPDEKEKYGRAIAAALRTPEVQAAWKVHWDLQFATMVKIDPAMKEINERLRKAWDAAKAEAYGKKDKPAEANPAPKP